ncbi:protein transport protein Sec31p [[Candida] railenensis]|uniref:Protein transport protein SEC31 n=1 Tax=[Candida] railenensis TaxID=45579 RepID=A0A9P0QUI3_9ASCO|nr:protein transport protein Sec31p [[Candida] railenensis]
MVKIAEISRTSTFTWSHECLPLLATGTVAGAVDLSFTSQAVLEIWDVFSPIDKSEPVVSVPVGARFHAIGWSKPFDKYSRGVIAGGFENGLIEFWDANVLLKTKDLTKASIHKDDKIHSGFVKSLSFHPSQDHVMVSGGDKGQIFVWDLKTFAEPKSPGSAMTPMEIISSVAWNQAVPHIFASTAGNSGYTSIWDLKAKREVLHLSYQGQGGTRANFSCVAWHPTQSTKLITASDNDGCPLILTWDLRNSNAPEKILTGHTQGVLSLDWCQQDPELLISSGKDNATMLWNPITGEKLGEYPTTANWAFQTKFAPQAPDIFATASFDGKIIVQSLQDTSPPVSTKVSQSNDDNQFWNEISTAETQQPKFDKQQAPKWLKSPVSVGFGFGSKLVSVKTDANGKSTIEINKFVSNNNFKNQTAKFSEAIKSGNFKDFIETKSDFSSDSDKKDWELLKKLSQGKNLLENESTEVSVATDEKEAAKAEISNGIAGEVDEDSFFDNLGKAGVRKSISAAASTFVPSGDFSIFASNASDQTTKLTKLILAGKIDEAVSVSIEQGLLLEAFVLALDGSKDTKQLVKNEYFKTNESNSISRLLYSVSSKNVTDIVANADIQNWRDIATSISSYATDTDDYNAKISELGDRILSLGGDRNDALLCYLSGNAIDKISTIWLSELENIEKTLLAPDNKKFEGLSPSDARFEALNIFVEKLATYRSLSNTSGTLSGPGIEKACKVLLEYSNLVAGYGEFELAEKFLEILPEDFAGLKLEKDRIGKATGKSAAVVNTSRQSGGRIPGRNSYSKSPKKPLGSVGSQPFVPPASINPGFNRPPIPNSTYSQAGTPSQFVPSAPIANPYAKSSIPTPVSNPYAPQASAQNPYKPSGAQFPSATNTFAPPPPTSLGSIAPPPTSSNAPAFKKEEGGWNDLPDTFKPKVAPRRATPSGVSSPSPIESPQPNIHVPKRTSSAAAAPVLPPPPKGLSRTPSKQTVPSIESPSLVQAQLNTRYAPPLNASAVVESPKLGNGFVETQTPTLPPKNPYAPSGPAVPPSRNAYAQPVPTNFQVNPTAVGLPTPPKNPYAPQASNNVVSSPTGILPPPPKAGGLVSPPIGGPPPMSSIPPPPPKGNSMAPTPSGSIPPPPPPTSLPTNNSTPPPAAPTKSNYPSGDRSHIPENALPIYTTLNSILEVIMPDLPAQYAKHGEAVVRRLNILFDHLNNGDLLSDEVINELKNLCSALNNKDYKEALALHVKLTTNHSEETSNWHPGVKHLIQMAEALL